MTRILSFLSLGLLLCGGGLTACKKQEAATPAGDKRSESVPVGVTTVTNVTWEREVSIVGTLYPKDEATIGAEVEGTVEGTLVDFGDRVRTGQELAFIDTALYEAQREQADGNLARVEANAINSRKNFARMAQLKKEGVASESEFDQAASLADQAEADIKAARGTATVARLNLERSKVRAPFDGAVAQRVVGKGDYVKSGSALFNLVNDSVLKFIFNVPERYGSFVRKTLPVRFGVDNYPGERFEGRVYLISPSVNLASRSFAVGALVTNTDFRLKANTFARGALVLDSGITTPVVPVDAVVNFAGISKVFVAEGSVAKSRTVVLGRIRDGVQEVLEGVKSGEAVVVSGQSRLTDGAAIAVKAPGSAAKEAKP